MTPEERTRRIALVDHGTLAEAIVAAIRAAENAALEQAAQLADLLISEEGVRLAEAVRALKHPEPE